MYECIDCLLDFAMDEGTLHRDQFFQCHGCATRAQEGKADEEYFVLEQHQ